MKEGKQFRVNRDDECIHFTSYLFLTNNAPINITPRHEFLKFSLNLMDLLRMNPIFHQKKLPLIYQNVDFSAD